MRVQFLLMIVLLNQVASSDVKQQPVLRGNDVHLHIIPTPDIKQGPMKVVWRFGDLIFLEYILITKQSLIYIDRNRETFTFSDKDYSLLLRNLNTMDNGLYKAFVVTAGGVENLIVTYKVTVQDEVSPVHLTAAPVFFSPDLCNVTVNCSSEDSSATITNTFTFDNHTQQCSKEGGESSKVASSTGQLVLHWSSVNVSDWRVICNHSNDLDWKNATMHLTPALCQVGGSGTDPDSPDPTIIKIIIVFSVVAILLVLGGAAAVYKWKRKRASYMPSDSVQLQNLVPATTNADSANVQHPEGEGTTIYSVIQPHSGSLPRVPATTQQPEGATTPQTPSNTTNTNPESLYAQVQKPNRR